MSNVVVLGASANPQRIAYQAVTRLRERGHNVLPVNPKGGEIQGIAVLASLAEIKSDIDTVTMYIAPEHQSAEIIGAIETLHPQRVIFNPGSENPAAYAQLHAAGIEIEEACTLVLLSTNQFDRAG